MKGNLLISFVLGLYAVLAIVLFKSIEQQQTLISFIVLITMFMDYEIIMNLSSVKK